MAREPLPVDEALPRLTAALRTSPNAVLRAPPGAGKTTRVPQALLDGCDGAPGLAGDGLVIVLEPRRIAARAAARRIASERGTEPGTEVGWHVRFERRSTRATRILVVTEGIFLRRIQEDPFLEGVACVVFDEFHERNLASDLALAMVRRVQREMRPDLRVVVMSATIDTEGIAAWLGAQVIESAGFLHPVEVRRLERPDDRRIEEQAASGARMALAATAGDVLVFLPGTGEIRRTAEILEPEARRNAYDVVPLYGDLPPEQQDRALARGPRRRVVLATNVAESSVTVEGVTAVVDTGVARVMRHDPARGMDALVLAPISKQSADQRTGRAGRVAPGVSFRMWTLHEERAMPDRAEPEVRRVDLASSVLELLAWGERDVAAFPWFEAPEPARLAAAADLLERLGATRGGQVTEIGRAMVRIPVHPRSARLLVEGHRLGFPRRTALAAALLSERDPIAAHTRPRGAVVRSESDLLDRIDAIEAWEKTGSRRAAIGDLHEGGARFVARARDQLADLVLDALGEARDRKGTADDAVLRAILAGYPDRLARRRSGGSRRAVLVTGQGVRQAEESSVDAELFIAVDIDAGVPGEALVRSASAVRREWLPAERLKTCIELEFDETAEKVVAFRRTRFDELVIDEAAAPVPDDERAGELLAEHAAAHIDRAFDLSGKELGAFIGRVRWLRDAMPDLELPAIDDDTLRGLLADLCPGRRSFEDLRRAPVLDTLRAKLTRKQIVALEREAPERITVPSGSHVSLRYEPGRAPVLAVRIQEIFGWRETPRLAGGRVPILLHLLAPNLRPQQVTEDLASFWKNTYPDVRRELKRKYPRHSWPEDPYTAQAERRPQRRRPE